MHQKWASGGGIHHEEIYFYIHTKNTVYTLENQNNNQLTNIVMKECLVILWRTKQTWLLYVFGFNPSDLLFHRHLLLGYPGSNAFFYMWYNQCNRHFVTIDQSIGDIEYQEIHREILALSQLNFKSKIRNSLKK